MTDQDQSPATATLAPASSVALDVDNKSNIWAFLWVGLYSALLMIPTLTLFRFWGRTIVRRKLWGDTTIGGEPLEYTGKGSELLVGFLIAIVTVVLPVTGILVSAQLFLPPLAAAAVIVVMYFALFVLVGAAVFLARRYQLSRTMWRAVRFEQRGSPVHYGLAMLGYLLLTVVTLGWFAPAMTLRLERKLWANAYFGDMNFSYDNSKAARTEPVYLSYILVFLGVIGLYALIAAAIVGLGLAGGAVPDLSKIAQLYGVMFLGGIVLGLLSAWHQAALVRQITKSISLGDVKLRSRISAWDIIELAITNALLVIFTLGIGLVAAQARVWRRICLRLDVEGALDLARIQQAASRGPRSGEGMADAFDIAGGV